MSEPAGPRFGPYVLEAELGRGGMGVVYRAYDTVKDRTVALKLLSPELALDRVFRDRFRRESKLAARLSEPHIIPIHDYGQIDGRLYIDMRLVSGTDLAALVRQDGALAPGTAAWIIAQIGSALDAAHADGLIHRDIKPSNILVTGPAHDMPFAYLIDFGIARALDASSLITGSAADTVGTLAYMAPERISGAPGDRRADVYSLACVLHECLTGRQPFTGEMVALMWAQLNADPPAPSRMRPGLPAGLDAVTGRGMAKDPAVRYATAGELAAAVLAATASPRPAGAEPVATVPADQPAPLWEGDRHGRGQAALRAIVSDPDHGIAALSSAQAMSALLAGLLPGRQREVTVLVAAAEAGLAGTLAAQVAAGMDPAAACALAARSLAARTGFRTAACRWAAGELAAVLDLDPGGTGPDRGLPGPATPARGRARRGDHDWSPCSSRISAGSSPACGELPM